MGRYTTFLFAEPSFVEGMARLFDFGDTLTMYNESESDAEADDRAIRADWLAVGDDLRQVIERAGGVKAIQAKKSAGPRAR